MKETIKIIFIGGLDNGKIIYNYLLNNKYVDLKLVFTYPQDKEKTNAEIESSNVIKTLNVNKYVEEIKKQEPDYIFVAGWSELLNENIINIPQKGTIGFHPSKLPFDKGRSVLAWQIEEGYTETALTMFYYNDFPDGGDIIAQEKIIINFNDYIGDVLNKVNGASYNLIRAYFPLIRKGIAPRKKQDLNTGSFRRLRTDKDSEINWNKNAVEIYNKIRAVSKPYPGAFFIHENNRKIRIWKSEMPKADLTLIIGVSRVGEIVAVLRNNEYIVKCKDSFLIITCDYRLNIGEVLS